MNLRTALFLLAMGTVARAADSGLPLSAERINRLDRHGYFTPRCKQALVDLVQTQEALTKGQAEEGQWALKLPSLKAEEQRSAAQVENLRKELTRFAHPEDEDFAALQDAAHDSAAPLEKKLDLAQAFIWSYPTDPRQAEAVQDLQRWQNDLASRRQAIATVAANQEATRMNLLQRVKARDLSLAEWQAFLGEMSQEELLANLGPPQRRGADSWYYPGKWTWDTTTKERAGLLIDFNGTRVSRVSALSP